MTEQTLPPEYSSEELCPVPEKKEKKRSKRGRTLFIITILFLCIGLAWLIYYLWWGRFSTYTNDAYVAGNMVELTSQISASTISINTDNTHVVEQGQLLIELDPTDFLIAFDAAKAKLAQSLRTVVNLFEQVKELEAKAEIDQAQLIKATQDFQHRENLVDLGGVSLEDFEHSEAALKTAFNTLILTHHQLKAAISQIDNTTVTTHPLVEQAKNKLRDAWVKLQRCKIYAPVRGIVSQRKVQVGEWVDPNDPLLAIVPLDQIWVDANFKEVQLKHLRIGQPVKVTSDMYGRSVVFHGKLIGLTGGTGAVFSVLPPQNATGNWIKIVQRLTVRVQFDPEEIKKNPLMLGLSLEVRVNTHERDGMRLPQICPPQPIYETDIFRRQIQGAEEVIEEVILENVDPVYLADNRFAPSFEGG